ncbi:MAG: mononuclear molybdenum enzyme YedY, partial [Boseongicola sp.]|nr:mononuclear molybdenum enzyme YedY [Boseongicola sp.]
MAGRYKSDLNWSDVTPKDVWLNRRKLMAGAGAVALGSIAGPAAASLNARKTAYGEGFELNTWDEITSYNNFYEFGTDKGDPARYSGALTTEPWTIEIGGLVDRPG